MSASKPVTPESPVAIVTGSTSGIGRATALLLAEKGYQLSLSGRDEAAMAKVVKSCLDLGVPSTAITTTIGDLRDEATAADMVRHTVEKFGRINALVNSAGVLVNGTLEQSQLTDFDRVFDVNVRSVVHLTRLVVPYLKTTRGVIVNVSSIAGQCAFPGVTYYCMSKAALDAFTKCLALELAPVGVRVNSINPGVIVSSVHKRAGMSDAEYSAFLDHSKTTHPLGRTGTADEAAQAVYFLVSDASSFTTGHLLTVDGGRGIVHPR